MRPSHPLKLKQKKNRRTIQRMRVRRRRKTEREWEKEWVLTNAQHLREITRNVHSIRDRNNYLKQRVANQKEKNTYALAEPNSFTLWKQQKYLSSINPLQILIYPHKPTNKRKSWRVHLYKPQHTHTECHFFLCHFVKIIKIYSNSLFIVFIGQLLPHELTVVLVLFL